MVRILELHPEPGDQKMIVRIDDAQLDRAHVRIEREGDAPIETEEALRKAAA
jgi:hypothetical protein